MYPALSEFSIIINATNYGSGAAGCSTSNNSPQAGSNNQSLDNGRDSAPITTSSLLTFEGGYIYNLTGLKGSLRLIRERFTLHSKHGTPKPLDGTAVAVADNVSVTLANDNHYPLDAGLVSA